MRTSPSSVLDDYKKLMHLAEVESAISKNNSTIIKLNLSWTKFFPACSTAPWQLEGVLKALREFGYEDLVAVENQTVVTHPWKGAYNNKWLPVLEKSEVEYLPLTNVEWIQYNPKSEMLAMYDIFKEILIPKIFLGKNMIHLPTMKTHGHTTTTGSIKNAFGGLIPKYRHHAHRRIHEILVDLLAIQREIHKGIFSIMDGSVCGNGAGPRTIIPITGNIILAGNDSVSVDAIAAKIMGFEPLRIDYIRIAHDKGLGIGDTDQIELIGLTKNDFNELNFNFKAEKSPIIKWDQRLRKKTYGIHWLHHALFHSTLFKVFILSSEFYHDRLWYPIIGAKMVDNFQDTDWGRLFRKYGYGTVPNYKEVNEWNPY